MKKIILYALLLAALAYGLLLLLQWFKAYGG